MWKCVHRRQCQRFFFWWQNIQSSHILVSCPKISQNKKVHNIYLFGFDNNETTTTLSTNSQHKAMCANEREQQPKEWNDRQMKLSTFVLFLCGADCVFSSVQLLSLFYRSFVCSLLHICSKRELSTSNVVFVTSIQHIHYIPFLSKNDYIFAANAFISALNNSPNSIAATKTLKRYVIIGVVTFTASLFSISVCAHTHNGATWKTNGKEKEK